MHIWRVIVRSSVPTWFKDDKMQDDVVSGIQRVLGLGVDVQALTAMLKLVEQGCNPQSLIQIAKDAGKVSQKK